MEKQGFKKGVAEKLGYYVYRLIDPRNGNTFYVGKGKGDRVFAHVNLTLEKGELDNDAADDDPLKIQTIRAIRAAGLEVVHIIHRHGMDEKTALEVEAALIDAYPGLSNLILGHNTEFGIRSVKEIEDYYGAEPANFGKSKCVVIKNAQSYVDENNGSYYDAVRYAWRMNIERGKKAEYVMSAVNGIIRDVFVPDEWHKIKIGKINPGFEQFGIHRGAYERVGFIGHPAPAEVRKKYIGKSIVSKSRSPILYYNM